MMDTPYASAPALLTSVLTASQNGVMVYQAVRTADESITDLRLSMCNAVAERLLNGPAVEAVGQPFSRLFPQWADTDLSYRFRRVIETGQADRFEFQYTRTGQPSVLWLDISAVRLEDNVVVSYDDITQTKADAQAARQAVVFQQAFEASLNGILVFEAVHSQDDAEQPVIDFRLVMANEAGFRLSPYPREEMIGRTLWEIYPATGINGLFSQYKQVCETGKPITLEHYYPEHNAWREVSIVRVPNGVMATYNDTTAFRRSEQTIAQQTQLFDGVLANVPVGIAVLQAIRAANGSIADFRIERINSVLEAFVCLPNSQLTGRLLTSFAAEADVVRLLDRAAASVEQADRSEIELSFGSGWYRLATAPHGDQLIVAVTDISEVKQAQLDYQQQHQLLELISENTPAGMVLWEAVRDDTPQRTLVDFRYWMTNLMNAYITGQSVEALIGQNLLTLFPRFRGTELETVLRDAVETGRTQRMIFTYYTEAPGGWFDAQFSRVGDGVLMTFMDVTEQHEAQLAQKQLADTFDAVLKSISQGLAIMTILRDEAGRFSDLRYEHVSDQITRDTGLSRRQLFSSTLLTVLPGIKQSRWWAAFEAVIETGQLQQFDEHYTYDGYDHHVSCQAFLLDQNRLVATYYIIDDLKQAQQQAEEQARLLASVINNITAGVVLYDPIRTPARSEQPGQIVDFRIALANQAELQTTGLQAHELIGQRHNEVFTSPEAQDFFNAMVEVAESGQPREWLLPYNSDGINGWFQSLIVPHQDQILFTFSDVTELKRQQQALELANLELRRSNENLQQFTYVASHDLQEPLRKIQSFGDIIRETYAPQLDQQGQDLISRMQKSAVHMSLLIKDLLTYSRVSTHQLPFKPVSLDKLLAEVMDDLLVSVRESGAVVDCHDLPIVLGDETQLRQLFQNLISNAIKFHHVGVAPRVIIRSRRLKAADIPSAVFDPAVVDALISENRGIRYFHQINVTDNGIGFDEKYLDRIFQVFQRLHSKSLYAGTGVGLAICRKVIENHLGALTASSQPGAGATFTVFLPVIKPK